MNTQKLTLVTLCALGPDMWTKEYLEVANVLPVAALSRSKEARSPVWAAISYKEYDLIEMLTNYDLGYLVYIG